MSKESVIAQYGPPGEYWVRSTTLAHTEAAQENLAQHYPNNQFGDEPVFWRDINGVFWSGSPTWPGRYQIDLWFENRDGDLVSMFRDPDNPSQRNVADNFAKAYGELTAEYLTANPTFAGPQWPYVGVDWGRVMDLPFNPDWQALIGATAQIQLAREPGFFQSIAPVIAFFTITYGIGSLMAAGAAAGASAESMASALAQSGASAEDLSALASTATEAAESGSALVVEGETFTATQAATIADAAEAAAETVSTVATETLPSGLEIITDTGGINAAQVAADIEASGTPLLNTANFLYDPATGALTSAASNIPRPSLPQSSSGGESAPTSTTPPTTPASGAPSLLDKLLTNPLATAGAASNLIRSLTPLLTDPAKSVQPVPINTQAVQRSQSWLPFALAAGAGFLFLKS